MRSHTSAGSTTALAIASAATFMAYLDVTVVNVAFPDLAADFENASLTSLSWTVSAYALAFAALLAPSGRIADLAGRRSVFVGGVGAFAQASTLAMLAPSVGGLIVARLLPGAGAAAMVPAALGIVLATAAPESRMAAIGAWGAAGSLAAAAGPTLGGILVDGFGWRAVFALNLPLAALTIVAALRGVPALPGHAGRRPADTTPPDRHTADQYSRCWRAAPDNAFPPRAATGSGRWTGR